MSTGLTFNILGRDVSASSALKHVESEAKSTTTSIGSHFKAIGGVIAGAFAGAGVASFFSDAIGEATEAQQVGAQTTAVLKSTGSAAGVTANQIGNLATAISNKAGIDDEAIQSGENLLLTFTNVRNEAGKGNDIFNQATQAMTDLSAATGQDLKGSAIQLGKALNDPIKGVTALSRVGVSFTDQQKTQIAAMVDAGNTMGAQKVILGELNKEFAGSAAAQATPAMKAKVAWGNLEEQIGTGLLPVIGKLASFLTNTVVPVISSMVSWLGRNKDIIKLIALALAPLAAAWVAWTIATKAQAAATAIATGAQEAFNVVMDANPVVLVATAIAALAAGLIIAWKHSKTFRDVVKGVFDKIKEAAQFLWHHVLKPIFDAWKLEFRILRDVIKAVWQNGIKPVWDGLKTTAQFVWNQVLKRIFDAYKTEWRALSTVFKAVWQNGIKPVVTGVADVWKTTWDVVQAIYGKIKDGIRTVRDVIHTVVRVIKGVFRGLGSGLQAIWDNSLGLVFDGIVAGIGAVVDAIKWIINKIKWIAGHMPDIPDLPGGGGGLGGLLKKGALGALGPVGALGGIFGLAQGSGFTGGLRLVGENGPELVNLPRGSQVVPHSSAVSQFGGAGGDVIVQVNVPGGQFFMSKADLGRALIPSIEAAVNQGMKIRVAKAIT